MILCDTGFWYALANKKDRFHLRAIEVATQLNEDPITTWPVVTETCHLLTKRISTDACISFVKQLNEHSIKIQIIEEKDLIKIHKLMKKYADLPMDLADASLVLLAEKLGHGRILSTDKRDFHSYRWKNRQPFQNLLLEE